MITDTAAVSAVLRHAAHTVDERTLIPVTVIGELLAVTTDGIRETCAQADLAVVEVLVTATVGDTASAVMRDCLSLSTALLVVDLLGDGGEPASPRAAAAEALRTVLRRMIGQGRRNVPTPRGFYIDELIAEVAAGAVVGDATRIRIDRIIADEHVNRFGHLPVDGHCPGALRDWAVGAICDALWGLPS